jgi:CMP-2-keto-3-deoxyoctulosonic acid synthetase
LEEGNKIKIAITQHQSVPIDTAHDVEKVRRILDSGKE